MNDEVFTPLEWFCKYDSFQLNPLLQNNLGVLEKQDLSSASSHDNQTVVLAALRALQNPREKAFALLIVSRMLAKFDCLEKTELLIFEALEYCIPHTDQAAIAEWLLGSVQWHLRKGVEGYDHWQASKQIFQQLIEDASRDQQKEKGQWFTRCVNTLDYLVEEILVSVEAGSLLLNRFKPGLSDPMLQTMVAMLRKEVKGRKFERAKALIALLLSESLSCQEVPEVWVECGLAVFEMEDYDRCLDFLKAAYIKYKPDEENQIAVSWILGAVYNCRKTNPNFKFALENWLQSRKMVMDQINQADKDNRVDKKAWYTRLERMMRQVMEQKITTVVSLVPPQ